MNCKRNGFTLIEMLVVIGIIGLLIAALVPVVKGAQVRAKEAAIKAQCANLEAGLAAFAQNHGGNYPGVAVDVMAPWADHALGDPALMAGGGGGTFGDTPGRVVTGVLGNLGHANASTAPVAQQLKTVKDTPLGAAANNTARYFDSLILADAIQEFPPNPLVSTPGTNQRARMRNIFRFSINMATFDPNAGGWSVPAAYNVGINSQVGGTLSSVGGSATPDPTDTTRVFITGHYPGGVPLANFNSATFSEDCSFGTDEGDFYAPGDFAYVPVLSSSAAPFGDTAATLENEQYRWGTTVRGYLLFGYGDKSHKGKDFEDEEREFANNGLPGYGGTGVDTDYESVVLQLFEGAIYFSKKT
jgi:prepilin-type N-terminal cleavage/methylation domain-containing protein